jgi:opacity protein-like surface antigen
MSKYLVLIWHVIGLVKSVNQLKIQMKAFFSILIALLCLGNLSAQNTMGFNFQTVLPTGELKNDSPDLWGGGFAVTGAFNLKDSPIFLGGTLDFTRYGSQLRNGWHGSVMGDYRHRRQFEMSRLLGFIRISPDCDAGFYPYVDFNAGVNFVFTRSILRDSALEDPFDRYLDWHDFSFTYGIGAGVEIPVNPDILIDINFKTLKSGKTEYLTPNSVSFDTEQEIYLLDVQRSRFDTFTFSIGIKAYID